MPAANGLVHATAVALRHGKGWRAVLLRGPSGAGKSDLALRLIDSGDRLVADDQTRLTQQGRALLASAPPALAGLIEVRGLGIVKLKRSQLLPSAPVGLLVDLVPPGKVERLPDLCRENLLGIDFPRIELAPFEASAVTKLHLALTRIAAG
jgi:HPr kinase/phosphorylase